MRITEKFPKLPCFRLMRETRSQARQNSDITIYGTFTREDAFGVLAVYDKPMSGTAASAVTALLGPPARQRLDEPGVIFFQLL